MSNNNNKISVGLHKLLQSKSVSHFENQNDIFLVNPQLSNSYLNLFSFAQVAEVANSEFKF